MFAMSDTLFSVGPDIFTEQTWMLATNGSGRIAITLHTRAFRVEYSPVDGAYVNLSRSLTSEQSRQLAKVLLEAADKNDDQQISDVNIAGMGTVVIK